jgi:hypothetical protein
VKQTDQHPRLTVAWALHSLELALQKLGEGASERRVRSQFHQLVLAIERHSNLIDEPPPDQPVHRDPPEAA